MTRRGEASFAGVLILVMALAVMLPPALGALGPFLIDDLGLERSQLGVLASVASFASAVLAPSLGRVVDAHAGRRLLAGMFLVIGLGLVSVAAAPSFAWLVPAALVVGVGMALSNPATNRLVAAYGAPGRQGVLIGLKQSGVQVGALTAGALLPTLATLLGWRGAFGVVALVAFVAAATGWKALPAHTGGEPRTPIVPPVVAPATPPAAAAGARVPTDSEERTDDDAAAAETRWLALFSFVMAAGTSATVTYLPLYGFDAVGYDAVTAGAVGATLAFVGIGGRIGWARFADRRGDPWQVLAWLGAGAASAQLLLLSAPRIPPLVWVGAALLGATLGAWNAVVQLTIVRGGLRGSGRRTGVVHLSFSAGMVAGPALFGLSVDRLDTYATGWLAILGLNLVACAMAWGWRARHARIQTNVT